MLKFRSFALLHARWISGAWSIVLDEPGTSDNTRSTGVKSIWSQAGATKLEYALLASVISVSCIAPLFVISQQIQALFAGPISNSFGAPEISPADGGGAQEVPDDNVYTNTVQGGGTESSTTGTAPPKR